MWKSLFIKSNHCQALPCLDCIMFITYISIDNEYCYIQKINKDYTGYRIDKNCISMTPLLPMISQAYSWKLTRSSTCVSLFMTTPSMQNSKIGGLRISLVTHNAWNLEALASIKLSLNHCITHSEANSRSVLISLMSSSLAARLLSSA